MSAAAPLQTATAAPQTNDMKSSLLQRKCACGSPKSPLADVCEDCQSQALQTKLAVGSNDDPLEREADRIADQVMATRAHHAVSGASLHIQPYAGQATEDTDTAPASVEDVPPIVNAVLSSPGQPLDAASRGFMERRFGHDFSQVRVHTGAKAEESAVAVDADAYTSGSNIVFAAARYAPATTAGQRLLAHELTHVIQQEPAQGLRKGLYGVTVPKFDVAAERATVTINQGGSVCSQAAGAPPAIQFQRRHSTSRTTSQRLPNPTGFLDFLDEQPDTAQKVLELSAAFQELERALPPARDVISEGQFRDRINSATESYRQMDSRRFTVSGILRWVQLIEEAQSSISTVFGLPPGGGASELGRKMRRVAELRNQVRQTDFVRTELQRRRAAGEQDEPGPAPEPIDPERQYVDNIYIRDILANVYQDSDGTWQIIPSRGIPAMESFVRQKATEILLDQRSEVIAQRDAMQRSWSQAEGGEQTAIVENIQRARRVVSNAQEFREQLRADEDEARRLGILTRGFSDPDWEVLQRISAPRSMQGLDDEQLPSADQTRELVQERYQQRIQQDWGAIVHVVRVERNRQIQAVTAYINAIYHGMPFLQHLIENDLQINAATLSTAVGSGFQDVLHANREARRAIYRIDAFSMQTALDAAVASLPEEIQDPMRGWIAQERQQEAVMDTLESLGIATGLVLLALVPVVGPELAFAAGVAVAARGEAEFHFQDVLADASLSPDEALLGVARPGAFEVWMNRLGPILDIAFAGAGRGASALTREARAARAAVEATQVEMEIAEAGIRELSGAEYAARVASQEEALGEFGARALPLSPDQRLLGASEQMEEEAFAELGRAAVPGPSTERAAVESAQAPRGGPTDAGEPPSRVAAESVPERAEYRLPEEAETSSRAAPATSDVPTEAVLEAERDALRMAVRDPDAIQPVRDPSLLEEGYYAQIRIGEHTYRRQANGRWCRFTEEFCGVPVDPEIDEAVEAAFAGGPTTGNPSHPYEPITSDPISSVEARERLRETFETEWGLSGDELEAALARADDDPVSILRDLETSPLREELGQRTEVREGLASLEEPAATDASEPFYAALDEPGRVAEIDPGYDPNWAPEGRLRSPAKSRGSWIEGAGARGDGRWQPHRPSDFGLDPGQSVLFEEGVPNLREYAVETPSGREGIVHVEGLDGTRADYARAVSELARQEGMTFGECQTWLREQRLRIHHYGGREMQIVPERLHDALAHQGSASELRDL